MSSIEKREQAGKTTYVARWRDPAGKQRKKSFSKKRLAEQHLTGIGADRLRGIYIDPRAGRITVKDYAETRWLPRVRALQPNERTRKHYETQMRNIIPILGDRPLSSLRRVDARDLVTTLTTRTGASTAKASLGTLRTMLSSAVEDELIPANPARGIAAPGGDRGYVEPLPVESVQRLLNVIDGRYKVMIWLAAGAGLRFGEVVGLRSDRVDFLRRRIYVVEQFQGVVADGEPVLEKPKSNSSRRTVPVDDVVLNAVTAHMQTFGTHRSGLLVTHTRGEPLAHRSTFHRSGWVPAVEAAELPKGTRFHDLRHFYASSLIAANLHPKTIQVRMGHATMKETMDTYGHLFPAAEDEGRGAIAAAFDNSGTNSLRVVP